MSSKINRKNIIPIAILTIYMVVTITFCVFYVNDQMNNEIYYNGTVTINNGFYNMIFQILNIASILCFISSLLFECSSSYLVIVGWVAQGFTYIVSCLTFITNCEYAQIPCHTIVTPLYVLVLVHVYVMTVVIPIKLIQICNSCKKNNIIPMSALTPAIHANNIMFANHNISITKKEISISGFNVENENDII